MSTFKLSICIQINLVNEMRHHYVKCHGIISNYKYGLITFVFFKKNCQVNIEIYHRKSFVTLDAFNDKINYANFLQ